MSDLPALLPCPHCGAEAQSHAAVAAGEYWVNCRNHDCPRDDIFGTPAEAIAAWNARAPDDALTAAQAEIASLRSLLALAEGALEPFDKAATYLRREDYDARVVVWIGSGTDSPAFGLQAYTLRTAAAAYAAIRAAKEKTDAT